MPEAVFSAGPMPCPVSRYQLPLSRSISMPAAFHSSSSAKCVPLRSPRETKGALAFWIFFSASIASLPPATLRGIRLRPDQHEVVVHDLVAPHAVALGDELLLERPGVHEHHVGVAAPRHVERLAGAERDHAHLDAGLLLEDRQQVLEEPGLLGRGRRSDGDEALLRLRRHACHGYAETRAALLRIMPMAALL